MGPETEGDAGGLPWRPPSAPESLAALSDEQLANCLYVVVEEKIDRAVGLLVSPWPGTTLGGRLRFDPEDDEVEVAVDLDDLNMRLSDRDVSGPADSATSAAALAQRPVEVGDAFAVRTPDPAPTPSELEELGGRVDNLGWMVTVVDITADAREAAKVATYEALTPPLKQDVIEELREESGEVAQQ